MEGSLWMDLQMTIHKLQKTIYHQLTCLSGRSVEIHTPYTFFHTKLITFWVEKYQKHVCQKRRDNLLY